MFTQGSYNVDGQDSFVESHDFSKANMNQANRLHTVTLVASICYNNTKAIDSESLFNRLKSEAGGLPSSAYEFVPVLLDYASTTHLELLNNSNVFVKKYGELLEFTNDSGVLCKYLLTNYRALVFDYENQLVNMRQYASDRGKTNEWIEAEEIILKSRYLEFYNNEAECSIIKKYFKVYKFKVDLSTRSQMVRHRVNWQELSRRYVSGKRVPFDFYISEKMDKIETDDYYTMKNICDICVNFYNTAIDAGIKPQEARRIIPQAMYTELWGAFQPKQLENFYNMRLDDAHAQREINLIAKAMKGFE